MLLHNFKNKFNTKIIKATLLLMLLIASSITTLPIFHTTKVSALTTSDSKNTDPKWQIQSFQYYKVISACMESASFNTDYLGTSSNLQADKVNNGKWFRSINQNHVGIGVFMKDAVSGDPYEVGNDGITNCGDPDLINNAMDFWGLNKFSVFCNSDYKREGQEGTGKTGQDMCTDENSNAVFIVKDEIDRKSHADKFKQYIKQSVYGISRDSNEEISLTDPEKYIFYLHTIAQSCIPQIESTKPDQIKKPESDSKSYNNVDWVDTSVDPPTIINGSYTGVLNRDDTVGVDFAKVSQAPADDESVSVDTCLDLRNKLDQYAPAFLKWAVSNKVAAAAVISHIADSDATKDDSKTCGGEVTNVGWIICPVVTALTSLNDLMWTLTSNLLNVSPLEQADSVYSAWGIIRNLANIIFVIVFLIIIFSQVSNIGVSNYGIKKMLPKLVIGAILVNLSFLIVQIAVDIANITGSSLYSILIGMTQDRPQPSWNNLLNAVITLPLAAFGISAGIALTSGSLIWMIALFAIMGCLTLLAAFITLIFRQAIIPILAILAPLAFVAYLLPNTEKWFDKWKDMLIQMLMLYPLAALVFGGARFASSAIYSSDENHGWWMTLISLIVLCLPLFSLPFLATKGGAILSKVSGALTGLTGKLRNPISGYTNSHGELAKEKYLATKPGKYNIGKRAHFAMRRSSSRRSLQSEAYKKQSEDMFSQDLRENGDYFAGGVAAGSVANKYISDTVMRLDAKNLTDAIQSFTKEIADYRASGGKDDDGFITDRIINRNGTATALEIKAAQHTAGALGRDDILRTERNKYNTAPANETDQARQIREKKLGEIQEAISANAGKLASKAPDLVKNRDDAAFEDINAHALTDFSKGAAGALVKHLESLRQTAATTGSVDDVKKYAKAVNAFNNSVREIASNPELRSKFEGATGKALRETISANPGLGKALSQSVARIDISDDKIR